MNLKTVKILELSLIGGGIILYVFGSVSDTAPLYIVSSLLLVSGLLVNLFCWRCPACKQYLGRNSGITYCPHCGTRLDI